MPAATERRLPVLHRDVQIHPNAPCFQLQPLARKRGMPPSPPRWERRSIRKRLRAINRPTTLPTSQWKLCRRRSRRSISPRGRWTATPPYRPPQRISVRKQKRLRWGAMLNQLNCKHRRRDRLPLRCNYLVDRPVRIKCLWRHLLKLALKTKLCRRGLDTNRMQFRAVTFLPLTPTTIPAPCRSTSRHLQVSCDETLRSGFVRNVCV